jgi:hypothetical protein
LLDGNFELTIGIHSPDESTVYDWWEHKSRFEVMNPTRKQGQISLPMRVDGRPSVQPAREAGPKTEPAPDDDPTTVEERASR